MCNAVGCKLGCSDGAVSKFAARNAAISKIGFLVTDRSADNLCVANGQVSQLAVCYGPVVNLVAVDCVVRNFCVGYCAVLNVSGLN